MTKKRILKPYHGILLLLLAAVDIFFLGDWLGVKLGLYGTAIQELILLGLAVGTVAVFGGNFRWVFPFREPKAEKIFGTLILWLGTYLGTMALTMILAYFFPQQVLGVSSGLSSAFVSVPFLASFVIVVILPAICEEAVFRGVFLNSLWGGLPKKWPVILIVAAVFGAFHGSIWRFLPTFLLGITMGYLLFETGNMFYNMLFHAVNNLLPVAMLYGMQKLYSGAGLDSILKESANMTALPLASIGSYLMYGGAAPLLIYIGNYLLHRGQPGYEKELFWKEKKGTLLAFIIVALVCMIVGVSLVFATVLRQVPGIWR